MKTLITGSTGFIGRKLLQQLLPGEDEIHLLCRKVPDDPPAGRDRVKYFRGDILDAESVLRSMEGCDRVYHLAAYAKNWAKTPAEFHRVNVDGLRNVLRAAVSRGVGRVVFTSTSVTIGPSNGAPQTEGSPRPVKWFTEYEHSKILAEAAALEFAAGGLEVVTVNPTRVFGPGLLNEGNSATRMIDWYLDGKWRIILGDGRRRGNYGFVDDVARGHILAMERGKPGERYILGGENCSYNEFFGLLADVSGKRHRLFHVPAPLALSVSSIEELRGRWSAHYPLITPGWVRTFARDWSFSTRKSELELGYRVTPLREALERTVRWLETDRHL
jgi:nucleoside-diphosphate-sugar epimerase